ncbi:hypothetical protein HZZ13_01700 [Bradyrhizobium sp. CNPSo 4010]|uniref:Uncharacterized protein n=1 Tax=Bradyrhizobium agreste TaxID=2751811 RepID=A0ABS0PH49_9BRAD|nr:hypothetical protein [Bradyrhizobium agreste]MBH5396523.1 hypothetical protein [Bradyrhizobium agreste]
MNSQEVIIHVRFGPNGRVIQISERPAKLTPNQWFDVLNVRASSAYRPLARGRGIFRLSRTAIEAFKQETARPGLANRESAT